MCLYSSYEDKYKKSIFKTIIKDFDDSKTKIVKKLELMKKSLNDVFFGIGKK